VARGVHGLQFSEIPVEGSATFQTEEKSSCSDTKRAEAKANTVQSLQWSDKQTVPPSESRRRHREPAAHRGAGGEPGRVGEIRNDVPDELGRRGGVRVGVLQETGRRVEQGGEVLQRESGRGDEGSCNAEQANGRFDRFQDQS